MKLSVYARRECLVIAGVTIAVAVTCVILLFYAAALLVVLLGCALLCFFRDPERTMPTDARVCVSPADGVITSIHSVEHFVPLNGSAVCIRIFLSVFNVHINRSPYVGRVSQILYQPGGHLNALCPGAAERNESNLVILSDSQTGHPIAAIRQISGMFARRVVCAARVGDLLATGQRFGMIKLGSTTELYLPTDCGWFVTCKTGQRVYAGCSAVAHATSASNAGIPESREASV